MACRLPHHLLPAGDSARRGRTLILRLIFQPGTGAVSNVLTAIHAQCDPNSIACTHIIDWFNDPNLLMPAAILMAGWAVGQPMLIYLAGLQGVDQSYYEVGLGGWRRPMGTFRYITLPLLTPTIFFNVVIGLIGAFQEFAKIMVLTGGENTTGGPSDSLLTTLLYVWLDAFRYHLFGYATAMAFGLFALILIFTLLNFAGQKRWVFYQEEELTDGCAKHHCQGRPAALAAARTGCAHQTVCASAWRARSPPTPAC